MDKNLIESYKAQMMKMYKSKFTPTMAEIPSQPTSQNTGKLIGVATQVKGLYFLPNTKVTVFKGDPQNMQVIATDFTDQNGKTKEFVLPTPPISLSEDKDNKVQPYALYNMMFEADGYLTNIHLNIPVFEGVTSRQTSNLLLLETAGVNKGPRIFDEIPNYNL